MQATALATLSNDDIIARIADGEYGAHIAKELGVSKQALQQRVRHDPNYLQAREIGTEVRLDRTMAKFDELEIARPPLKPIPTGETQADSKALAEWEAQVVDWKNQIRATSVDLARVDSLFRAVTWQAEREFPHRWGKTVAVTDSRTDLGERLRRAKERVIEGDAVQQSDVKLPIIPSPTK